MTWTDHIEGTWQADDLRRAFVMGAKWWEFHSTGGTMWPSDRWLAEEQAEKTYPGGKLPPDDSQSNKVDNQKPNEVEFVHNIAFYTGHYEKSLDAVMVLDIDIDATRCFYRVTRPGHKMETPSYNKAAVEYDKPI